MNLIAAFRTRAIRACETKAQAIAQHLGLGPVSDRAIKSVNIGAGNAQHRWPCATRLDCEVDFNTATLPYPADLFHLVICEQVIEHLHNTTHFLSELHRILIPGGTLLLATENLASLPNLLALTLQRAPFSTQPVCGRYVGGFNDRSFSVGQDSVAPYHPIFSGTHGHVRVLTTSQIRALTKSTGFREMSKHGFGGNHYVLFELRKLPTVSL